MKKDYVILNIEKEYPGYTGTEKWMIITDLTEDQFSKQYPKEYKRWKKAVWIRDALSTLPETQRRRVYMFYVLGMTVDDIVNKEKASRASVRQSLERGIANLREYCEVSSIEKGQSIYRTNEDQKGSQSNA